MQHFPLVQSSVQHLDPDYDEQLYGLGDAAPLVLDPVGLQLRQESDVGQDEQDDGEEDVLEPLGGESQEHQEDHVGGRVGDELDEGVPHEPAHAGAGGHDVDEGVEGEGAAQLDTLQHLPQQPYARR